MGGHHSEGGTWLPDPARFPVGSWQVLEGAKGSLRPGKGKNLDALSLFAITQRALAGALTLRHLGLAQVSLHLAGHLRLLKADEAAVVAATLERLSEVGCLPSLSFPGR